MSFQDPAKPPFRADHVGSLLRPQRLHDAREKRAKGEITDIDLRTVEDDCIREAIKGQENAGIKAITDGEFRRSAWHYDFLCSLEVQLVYMYLYTSLYKLSKVLQLYL